MTESVSVTQVESVWVAQVGMQDAECYYEGTDTSVSVHWSRPSAEAAVIAKLPEGSAVNLAAGSGVVYEDEEGHIIPDDDGDVPEDARFLWEWKVYMSPVLDEFAPSA